MDLKVTKEYVIPTEEFCAMDYNFKRKFFLKEVRPDVHKEISNCLQKAAEIEEINGIYPETFVNNTKHNVLTDNDIPKFIPVRVTNNYNKDNNYYICKDLFCEKEFIIPDYLLQTKFMPSDMWLLDQFMMEHNTDISTLINVFTEKLNPPRNIKRRLKKDTK